VAARRVLIAALALLAAVAATLAATLAIEVAAPIGPRPPAGAFNRGHNAVWLGVSWVMDARPDATVPRLARDLERRGVDTVFAYTSFYRDGAMNPTDGHAAAFVRALHRAAPGVRVEAWLGVPTARASLSDPAVRAAVVAFARRAVLERGFDGVHLDPEPVGEGDTGALRLLEETRAALPRGASLSFAAPWTFPSLSGVPFLPQRPWSVPYLRAVAARVDALAAMTYDSSLPAPWLYRAWMRRQVVTFTRALEGTGAALYVGLPAWREPSATHRPDAETIQAGLEGVLAGLNDGRARPAALTGVAVYAEWTATAADWRAYERLWLGR
jgi:hypothetical protein